LFRSLWQLQLNRQLRRCLVNDKEIAMTRLLVSLIAAVGLTSPAVYAADPAPNVAASTGVAVSTDTFLTQVASGNQFEIDSSKLALTKTKSEAVRGFATQMIADHSAAAIKFKQAIADAGLKAPAEGVDPKLQAIIDDMRKKDAAGFDKIYIDAQYKAHVETVALFEAYANKGDNPRIRQFAQELLPTLRSHLEHVTKLKGKG
jgi:putative membrane protein